MKLDNSNNWFVILNLASGNGFVKAKKDKILIALNKLNFPVEVKFTEYSGHEEILIKEAIGIGYIKFISVGGDGTLHHVVNGIMKFGSEFLSEIKVGIIPVGTGNDFVKQYSIPKNIDKAISIINKEKTINQDIGRIKLDNKVIYFDNLTGLGFDGFVVKTLPRFKKFGILSYFLSAIIGLHKFKPEEIIITTQDREIKEKVFLLAIGIGKFCGGGMRLTHKPNPTDGLLDLTLIKQISPFSFLLNILKMYNGKIANHEKVETYKTEKIFVKLPKNSDLFIQSDGELVESNNFQIEIVPAAISFVVA